MKNTLKNLIFIWLLLALLLCTACGKKEVESYDFKASELAKVLVDMVELEDVLGEVDKDSIAVKYEIADTNIENASVYMSTTATAEEIAVFVADDENIAIDIEEKCKGRIAAQSELYADYAPLEVTRLDNSYLTRKKNLVVLCVCKDSTQAEKIVEDYLKNL